MGRSVDLTAQTNGFGGWVARYRSSPGNVLDNIQALILDMSGNSKKTMSPSWFSKKKKLFYTQNLRYQGLDGN
jgi:hypothetical protein